jgi:hypothetical protein
MHRDRVLSALKKRGGHSEPNPFNLHDFKCAPFLARRAQSERHRHPGRVAHWQDAVGARTLLAPAHHQPDGLQKISAHIYGLVFDQRSRHPEDHRKLNLSADVVIKLISMTRSKGARY